MLYAAAYLAGLLTLPVIAALYVAILAIDPRYHHDPYR